MITLRLLKLRTGTAFLSVAAAVCIGGCSGVSGPRVVADPDPSIKIPAIKAVAETNDYSEVKQLVKDLESDDPAVRFYSITALEKLTGQTFGYQYFVDEEKRAPALGKWKAWLLGWEARKRESGGK